MWVAAVPYRNVITYHLLADSLWIVIVRIGYIRNRIRSLARNQGPADVRQRNCSPAWGVNGEKLRVWTWNAISRPWERWEHFGLLI